MEKGLTEDKISRLENFRDDPAFNERERIALELAEKMATNHTSIDDDFFRGDLEDGPLQYLAFRGWGEMAVVFEQMLVVFFTGQSFPVRIFLVLIAGHTW